ncbi:MAG: hypothetical protein ABIA67_01010 [Candidatus Margulisiibacteriota bacterium]
MFGNKYSHIRSLSLLKATRPRKNLIPQLPDLYNFITNSTNLKRQMNWGMEMMKFLPKLEQIMYQKNIYRDEGEADTVTFSHSDGNTTVTREWWEAFTEYDADLADIQALFATFDLNNDGSVDGTDEAIANDLEDNDGDGRITNSDTISWVEDNGIESNGWTAWRDDDVWIAGQHHRTGAFTSESAMAGQGHGESFRNLDFVAEASEWNHIGVKDNPDIKDTSADFVADQAYFVGGILSDLGFTWSDVTNLLETHPSLAGKSYYQIVMDGSYRDLNSTEAPKLMAAMYESRERAWAMMSEVFGPVDLSRNDQEMMQYIRNFINSSNPYVNHHAISAFPFFLEIQHSVQNRITTFFEEGEGQGFESSGLDRQRFWAFSQWTGRAGFDAVYDPDNELTNEDINESEDSYGALYDERKKYGSESTQYAAVDNLINAWFGATKPENGRPIWGDYLTDAENHSNEEDGVTGTWVTIPSTSVNSSAGGSWHTHNTTRAFVADIEHPAYAWDKKWGSYVYVKDGSDIGRLDTSHAGWADVMNELWSHGYIDSHINPAITDMPHPNYAVAQFHMLSYNTQTGGEIFANNWMVYANGMLMKWGQQLDMVKVMEKSSANRVASAEYKQDKLDYSDQNDDLQYEEAMDEKVAMQAAAKALGEEKKLLQRMKKRANANIKGAVSNNSNNSKIDEGSREKAMRESRRANQASQNAKSRPKNAPKPNQ